MMVREYRPISGDLRSGRLPNEEARKFPVPWNKNPSWPPRQEAFEASFLGAGRHPPSSIFLMLFCTVSFHNFKSQNFKLSVSNPKSKYVAYLSVLSQISNCQGLGRKNKLEILKTYSNTSYLKHSRVFHLELRRHRLMQSSHAYTVHARIHTLHTLHT